MNPIKLLSMIGAAGIVFAGSARALDWTTDSCHDKSAPILAHTTGVARSSSMWSNRYDWIRSVQLWQSFRSPASVTMTGISLQICYAQGVGNKDRTMDLNVYEGVGVNGRLVSSTKLRWNTNWGMPGDLDKDWFGFKLNQPVYLLKGKAYTFALENMNIDSSIEFFIDTNPCSAYFPEYMQQGYVGMSAGPRGYETSSNRAEINYVLWQ